MKRISREFVHHLHHFSYLEPIIAPEASFWQKLGKRQPIITPSEALKRVLLLQNALSLLQTESEFRKNLTCLNTDLGFGA